MQYTLISKMNEWGSVKLHRLGEVCKCNIMLFDGHDPHTFLLVLSGTKASKLSFCTFFCLQLDPCRDSLFPIRSPFFPFQLLSLLFQPSNFLPAFWLLSRVRCETINTFFFLHYVTYPAPSYKLHFLTFWGEHLG